MKKIRSILRIISAHLIPKIAYPVIRGPLFGLKFIHGAASGEGGGATIFFGLVEPKQTEAFKSALKDGFIVFDVGANIGYYTLLGSRIIGKNGKIFAFEPSIRNIEYLAKHIRINKITNAMIIPAACSDNTSISLFNNTPDCALGHLLENTESSETKFDIVPTLTIDSVVQTTGVFPDIVKIDVEGAELKVLHGSKSLLQKNHPVILLSVHSSELRISCLEYLSQFGYSAVPLDTSESGEPFEYMLSCSGK
ncbi:MAG: FkbM family methyltransferase [Fibrobacter sp.]|jgi:FkbM family methyltransferase|nr:FkbM family methyltransferase [Fibrobacter sp.]HON89873.1 FkbM family methyltransferase [Spirochaetales bacterium]